MAKVKFYLRGGKHFDFANNKVYENGQEIPEDVAKRIPQDKLRTEVITEEEPITEREPQEESNEKPNRKGGNRKRNN